MTKQEEIREELFKILGGAHIGKVVSDADYILSYLHSQGVVIKKSYAGMTHRNTWQEVFIVEPLVGEE